MAGDYIVYLVPGGRLYLGWFSEGPERASASRTGRWFEWPAMQDGWTVRRAATSSQAADAVELPQDLARLALRLSGVRVEDVA